MNPVQVVVLAPGGRLDAAGARSFEHEWKKQIAEGNTNLIVDLSDTRYISSSGLRTLLAAMRSARKHEGKLVLCCLSSRLVQILEMAGFDHVFEIFANRSDAESVFS